MGVATTPLICFSKSRENIRREKLGTTAIPIIKISGEESPIGSDLRLQTDRQTDNVLIISQISFSISEVVLEVLLNFKPTLDLEGFFSSRSYQNLENCGS